MATDYPIPCIINERARGQRPGSSRFVQNAYFYPRGVTIVVLHCIDQGMASHIVANCFVECMEPWGRNQEDRTTELERRIAVFYKENKQAAKIQGKLTFERLKTSNDWPKLKAKAAATRHLATLALELAVEAAAALHADAPAPVKLHARRRRAVCQLLVRFYTLLYTQGRYFTTAAKKEIGDLGNKLVKIYTQLALEALGARIRF